MAFLPSEPFTVQARIFHHMSRDEGTEPASPPEFPDGDTGGQSAALHDSESDHPVLLDRDDRFGAFQSAGHMMPLQIFPNVDQVPLRRMPD